MGGEENWTPKLFRKTGTGKGGPGDEPDEENLDWVINAEMYVSPIALLPDKC